MSQQRSFLISDYYENIDGKSVCKSCKKEFKSGKKFNLKSHIQKMHNINFGLNTNITSSITKYKTKQIKCNISKQLLIKSYIGLVTDEAVAFNVLNSNHMRNIIDPICEGIEKESGNRFCLNANNCKKTLAEVARNVIQSISSECANILISLKIDSATRLSRNIFGISSQYIMNDRIESRLLGMVELKGQHGSTSKTLAGEILNVLSKYNINLQQVISITSDNGSNMLKSSKILSHLCSEDDEYNENYNNEKYFDNINLIEKDTHLKVGDIVVCRCAAHTAQLVALDATKNEVIRQYIRGSRNLVKFLRKNSNGYKDVFELKSLNVPQLDCPTRWGSTYKMLNDIQNAKVIIETVEPIVNKTAEENFEINADYWSFIEAYCLTLNPLQTCIVKFQAEQLHYGDFYAEWLRCKLLIKKLVVNNAQNQNTLMYKISSVLISSIEKRTETLFANHAMTACLFLDPRFNHLLPNSRKNEAVTYLKTLWSKLTTICQIDANITVGTQRNLELDEEEDILNTFLIEEFNVNQISNDDVTTKIENLTLPFATSNINVLDFWKAKKNSDPELYALSNICFGIPPTQVSVERAFSTLKLILSDNRNRLKPETLENILLVKVNSRFLDEAISKLDLFTEHNSEEVV